ncbi:hypothetical protein B484DRAFT_456901 [Ochromonadaceae sp. CCMP2298]|nr:hypothetical protein B484DRAFT_456901 [Ochromonadaceae sp. CCMP2298]
MTSKKERFEAERLRQLHHNVAALLSVASLFAGYGKIGSLVILTHDVAEVPLDVFKFVSIKGWRRAQLLSLLATVLTWAYWRMWVFTTVVLASVVRESKSMMDKTTCTPGDCTWLQVPERLPFFICLLVFLFLNVVWLWRMCRIGHRLLFPNSQVDNSSDGSLFNAGNLGSPSPKSQHSHRV